MNKPSYEDLVIKQKHLHRVMDAARRTRDTLGGFVHLFGTQDKNEIEMYEDLDHALREYDLRYDGLGRMKMTEGLVSASDNTKTEVQQGNMVNSEETIPPVG